MELLTNSAKNVYMECPRKYSIMYEQGYRPVRESEALSFGKLMHEMLEKHFLGVNTEEIINEITAKKTPENTFEIIKAEQLFRGYVARWTVQYKNHVIEQEYRLPLVNPATAAYSKTWEAAGKIDAVIELENGEVAIMEHKTTKDDISKPDANYWLKLQVDPQITGYFLAAEKLGYKPTKIIYDVIGKPQIKPLKATPVEDRKFKKDGSLYANQRGADETPEEYAERLRQDISEKPDRYYQRREIARLESDITEFLQDQWSVGKLIMESRNENFWPRRAGQCFNYGRCPFFDVCSRCAMLEDESMFHKLENKNPELEEIWI